MTFASRVSAGAEAGGLPGGQEGPHQPDGCGDGQFVRLGRGHVQRSHGPVRLHGLQHQLLLRPEQEHLWNTK